MEPLPLPPPSTAVTTTTDTTASSPPPPPKLRLMCSYGGHIVPRPHDKSLCYIGGDTRIIVIDRHTSLSDLRRRLAGNLLKNQAFSLKYQLPNDDLDSLISITSDEDLENMAEEHDRLLNNAPPQSKPNRIRLFLFTKSPSSEIEQILAEAASIKSEEWFSDALNGKSSSVKISDCDFSESSSVNNLLRLDVEAVVTTSSKVTTNNNDNKNQELNAMPEKTSSFGSTSSSPSTANLPPNRTRVENTPKVSASGIQEQFQQMNVGNATLVAGAQTAAVGAVVSGMPAVVGSGEYAARLFSDDERPDHGRYRNVQQTQPQVHQLQQQVQAHLQHQQQIPPFQQIPSPDSASSEANVTNPLYSHKQAIYQEQFQSNQINPNSINQNNTQIQNQPQYDQNNPHFHQQQFIHTRAIPIPSYYPLYPSHQQPVMYYPSTGPQTRNIHAPKPEILPSNQHQAQYINYTQFHHPSAVNSAYTYEITDPSHKQMYYTPLSTQMAAQYPTGQLPTESDRTIQP